MRIVLVHGWGFHAGLWRKVMPLLGSHEIVPIDLGFIREGPRGEGFMPENSLCVGHSFGVMWLLKHGPRAMNGLVSIGGVDCFNCYLPTEPIAAMKAGLDRNPAAQMRGFWHACGLEEEFAATSCLDVSTLKAGLDWLSNWDTRERRRALGAPILALASEDDRIITKNASRKAWGDGGAMLDWIKSAGHALPLTAPEWCASRILKFAGEVGDRAGAHAR